MSDTVGYNLSRGREGSSGITAVLDGVDLVLYSRSSVQALTFLSADGAKAKQPSDYLSFPNAT